MNAKIAKKIRKSVRRDSKAFSVEFVREVGLMGLAARIKLCWKLIRMPRSVS